MKYTYNIYQWCTYNCCCTEIFFDMDPEALERHSAYFRWLLHHLHLPWHYRSPSRRFKELHLHPLQYWMHENALRYVLCAINKAKNGRRIFLEIPESFVLAVQVYQVVVFLQVEECIAALHGHIRQVIRERPLKSMELETVWYCLSGLAPRVYEFALNTQHERERQMWLLGPRLESEDIRDVEEAAESSGEETIIGTAPNQDTKMILDDINDTAEDEIGYTAEDEASDREDEANEQQDERFVTTNHFRRRSVPTAYSARMYDFVIDTSDFRECADEELKY